MITCVLAVHTFLAVSFPFTSRQSSDCIFKQTIYTQFLLCSFFFFSSRRRHTRLQGDWSSDVCSSDLPDSPFPGIPGANGTNGNSSIEVLTFLQFPTAGIYRMGVNSDDGFRVTEGRNPKDQLALNLGEYDGGRGPSDTLFALVVSQAGLYPCRLIWENGNGELPGNGASCER